MNEWINTSDHSRAELLKLAVGLPEVRALVEALRQAEWAAWRETDWDTWRPCCPWCERLEPQGHAPGCEYVAALTPFEDAKK